MHAFHSQGLILWCVSHRCAAPALAFSKPVAAFAPFWDHLIRTETLAWLAQKQCSIPYLYKRSWIHSMSGSLGMSSLMPHSMCIQYYTAEVWCHHTKALGFGKQFYHWLAWEERCKIHLKKRKIQESHQGQKRRIWSKFIKQIHTFTNSILFEQRRFVWICLMIMISQQEPSLKQIIALGTPLTGLTDWFGQKVHEHNVPQEATFTFFFFFIWTRASSLLICLAQRV